MKTNMTCSCIPNSCRTGSSASTYVNSQTCCANDGITSSAQMIVKLRMYLENQTYGALDACSNVFTASERSALLGVLDTVRDFFALENITGVSDPKFPALYMLLMHTINLKPEFLDAVPYFVNGRAPETPDTRPDAATILSTHEAIYARTFMFFGLMYTRRSQGTNGVAIDFLFNHDYSRYANIGTTSPILDAIQKLSTGTGNLCGNSLVLLTEPSYVYNGTLLGLNPDTMTADSCRDVTGPAVVPPGIYVAAPIKEGPFSFSTHGDELLRGRITMVPVTQDNWLTAMIASRVGIFDDQRWNLTLPPDFFDRCELEDRAAIVRSVSRRAGYLFNPDGVTGAGAGVDTGPGPMPGGYPSCNISVTPTPVYPGAGGGCGFDSDTEDGYGPGAGCGTGAGCSTGSGRRKVDREIYDINVALASSTLPENFIGDDNSQCNVLDRRVPRQGTILGSNGYIATTVHRMDAKINLLMKALRARM